jgi:beta-lactamase superfamily II metal-dependent hydrolase
MRGRSLLPLAALLSCQLAAAPARYLDIYWIDVEGGASTLIVTPNRHGILTDAGWGGFDDRDPKRIERIVKDVAGVNALDYLIVSHFHADHAGGIGALAKRVAIGQFLDHGDSIERDADPGRALWQEYLSTAGSRRRTVRPGERLSVDGVDLTIVAADGRSVASVPGVSDTRSNASCGSFTRQPVDNGENGRSLGYLLRFGNFKFLNLGDLSFNFQYPLACPINLLGRVDVYQVTHHGVRDDVLPQQMWSSAPTVAVMNNGPSKGAGIGGVETVLSSPGLRDLWSLHRLLANDVAHNAREPLTANLDDTGTCRGAWIQGRVNLNAESYTLTNSRNGVRRTYRIEN